MASLQFILETTREDAELVEDCLIDAGALAITLQDAEDHPLFEPKPDSTPLWPTTIVTALFEAQCDLEAVKKSLKNDLSTEVFNTLRIEPLEDKNWVQMSLDQFKPMQFGEHLFIYPTWIPAPENSNAVIVRLDPGLAFGTGTHPTTALCLEWLDQHPPQDLRVVDYGCGSGILTLAALKLGARHVFAVDYDPQALTSTMNNAKTNHLTESQCTLAAPETLSMPDKADLILANILADPIIALMPTFAELLKCHGQIVLSGLLQHQTDAVIAHMSPWFQNIEVTLKEEWARIHAIRILR